LVKAAVIGCGRIATSVRIPLLKGMEGVDVVAAADVDRRQLRKVASRYSIRETYTDYREMLREADADIVLVCTPPETHFQIVMDAIRLHKHVLCEKPLVNTVGEGLTLKRRLVEGNPQSPVLMPAHNFVYTPCFAQALQLIREGGIGEIREIEGYASSNLMFYRARTDFRLQAKGGVIEDQLPHLLYLSQKVGGRLQHVVSVRPRYGGIGAIEHVQVQLRLEGAVARLTAEWASMPRGFIPSLRLKVVGDQGALQMDLLRTPYNLTIVEDGKAETIHMGRRVRQYFDALRWRHPSYRAELIHFLRCVQGLEPPQVTVDDGVELARTLSGIMSHLEAGGGCPARGGRVAIVRVGENVEEAVRRCIHLLGGLRVKGGDFVVIKPNVCYPKNTENMILTDPRVLEAVIRLVKEKTRNVLVVESDSMSGTADYRMRKSGVMDILERLGVDFLNLSEDEVEEHEVDGLTLQIPKTLRRADFIINVPKIKTHEMTTITIAMKNMFGILANKRKMDLHPKLNEILPLINELVPQDLIVVDGIVGMEGLGPIHGRPKPLGLVVAGLNPVTVDAVCCHIMGFNPYGVGHLVEAYRRGMGEIDINRIEVLGEPVKNVRRKFDHPSRSVRNLLSALRSELRIRLGG